MTTPDVTSAARCTLVPFRSAATARRRLFCIPFAGGGPSTYRLWSASLPSDVQVVVVVLPGRDPRARLAPGQLPPGSIAEVLPAVLGAIAECNAVSPMPFAVFGHSLGALVAYEVTVSLEADGNMAPEHLFVSGRRPPDEVHTGAVIHSLPEVEFLDRMQEQYGGVPATVRNEPELLAMFLPALRADVQAFESYAPLTARAVRCPVRVYGGDRDRKPRPDDLPGWQRLAERPISIRVFPGDHFFLNDARDGMARDVAEHWASAVSGEARPSAGST